METRERTVDTPTLVAKDSGDIINQTTFSPLTLPKFESGEVALNTYENAASGNSSQRVPDVPMTPRRQASFTKPIVTPTHRAGSAPSTPRTPQTQPLAATTSPQNTPQPLTSSFHLNNSPSLQATTTADEQSNHKQQQPGLSLSSSSLVIDVSCTREELEQSRTSKQQHALAPCNQQHLAAGVVGSGGDDGSCVGGSVLRGSPRSGTRLGCQRAVAFTDDVKLLRATVTDGGGSKNGTGISWREGTVVRTSPPSPHATIRDQFYHEHAGSQQNRYQGASSFSPGNLDGPDSWLRPEIAATIRSVFGGAPPTSTPPSIPYPLHQAPSTSTRQEPDYSSRAVPFVSKPSNAPIYGGCDSIASRSKDLGLESGVAASFLIQQRPPSAAVGLHHIPSPSVSHLAHLPSHSPPFGLNVMSHQTHPTSAPSPHSHFSASSPHRPTDTSPPRDTHYYPPQHHPAYRPQSEVTQHQYSQQQEDLTTNSLRQELSELMLKNKAHDASLLIFKQRCIAACLKDMASSDGGSTIHGLPGGSGGTWQFKIPTPVADTLEHALHQGDTSRQRSRDPADSRNHPLALPVIRVTDADGRLGYVIDPRSGGGGTTLVAPRRHHHQSRSTSALSTHSGRSRSGRGIIKRTPSSSSRLGVSSSDQYMRTASDVSTRFSVSTSTAETISRTNSRQSSHQHQQQQGRRSRSAQMKEDVGYYSDIPPSILNNNVVSRQEGHHLLMPASGGQIDVRGDGSRSRSTRSNMSSVTRSTSRRPLTFTEAPALAFVTDSEFKSITVPQLFHARSTSHLHTLPAKDEEREDDEYEGGYRRGRSTMYGPSAAVSRSQSRSFSSSPRYHHHNNGHDDGSPITRRSASTSTHRIKKPSAPILASFRSASSRMVVVDSDTDDGSSSDVSGVEEEVSSGGDAYYAGDSGSGADFIVPLMVHSSSSEFSGNPPQSQHHQYAPFTNDALEYNKQGRRDGLTRQVPSQSTFPTSSFMQQQASPPTIHFPPQVAIHHHLNQRIDGTQHHQQRRVAGTQSWEQTSECF